MPSGIVNVSGAFVFGLESVSYTHLDVYKRQGKITIDSPYLVCTEGEKLDVRQALILKQFGIAASEFKVKVSAYYDNDSSTVESTNINME